MKLLLFPLTIGLIAAASAVGSDLGGVKTVYVLPMANGLDQYLAIRLTTGTSIQVVTDPQKADAVLTDRIGTSFEQTLDELYKTKPAKGEQDKETQESSRPMQAMTRGKGAIFLVDRKTRNVLWSTYAMAKSTAPDDMNHLADRIVSRLGKDRRIK
ncbi:MAG: hypothetical protein ABSB35_00880 [Bryobacteraceae bacterium]|jgi:hypothetical protein